MFTEDLDAFLSPNDFGVPVIMGAVQTFGVTDFADEPVLDDDGRGEVLARVRTVVVKTATLQASGLVDGNQIIVNGTTYRAGVAAAIEDGAFTRIPLGDLS